MALELGKIEISNKETMSMVEEVLNQIESLSKKVKHNQAKIAMSDEALDQITRSMSTVENKLASSLIQ